MVHWAQDCFLSLTQYIKAICSERQIPLLSRDHEEIAYPFGELLSVFQIWNVYWNLDSKMMDADVKVEFDRDAFFNWSTGGWKRASSELMKILDIDGNFQD